MSAAATAIAPTLPAFGPDYAAGLTCTWNGPIETAGVGRSGGGMTMWFVCPHCGGGVKEFSLEAWLSAIALAERTSPEYPAIMRWSVGRCFPDEETLVNAYRQATEE